ncbi:MAG TPA: ATP-dependent metallopeptidase FtsH/Yme1/Tma family protein, partial [Flavisolibacter sp.]|nr:ATP-dependent metallopeptidase FtsH/Yme1/Tma family protein [Flavisolibacter sp.]
MAQEPYNKNDKKTRLPKFNKNGGEGENGPKKGPRFSFYWVYAIIFAVLIGFQLFGNSFSPNAATITQNDFEAMILRGEVQEYTIVSNRN